MLVNLIAPVLFWSGIEIKLTPKLLQFSVEFYLFYIRGEQNNNNNKKDLSLTLFITGANLEQEPALLVASELKVEWKRY